MSCSRWSAAAPGTCSRRKQPGCSSCAGGLLQRHSGGRLPSLVGRYRSQPSPTASASWSGAGRGDPVARREPSSTTGPSVAARRPPNTVWRRRHRRVAACRVGSACSSDAAGEIRRPGGSASRRTVGSAYGVGGRRCLELATGYKRRATHVSADNIDIDSTGIGEQWMTGKCDSNFMGTPICVVGGCRPS